jgi:hypothetical protein
MVHYIELATEIIGSLGVLSTAISHLPFLPARTAAFFARFGMTTGKFLVAKKVQS